MFRLCGLFHKDHQTNPKSTKLIRTVASLYFDFSNKVLITTTNQATVPVRTRVFCVGEIWEEISGEDFEET